MCPAPGRASPLPFLTRAAAEQLEIDLDASGRSAFDPQHGPGARTYVSLPVGPTGRPKSKSQCPDSSARKPEHKHVRHDAIPLESIRIQVSHLGKTRQPLAAGAPLGCRRKRQHSSITMAHALPIYHTDRTGIYYNRCIRHSVHNVSASTFFLSLAIAEVLGDEHSSCRGFRAGLR